MIFDDQEKKEYNNNDIFESIVMNGRSSDERIKGMIAYCLYEAQRREYKLNRMKKNQSPPTDAELSKTFEIYNDASGEAARLLLNEANVLLTKYKQNIISKELVSEMKSEIIPIVRDIVREDGKNLQTAIDKNTGFYRSFFTSLSATIFYAVSIGAATGIVHLIAFPESTLSKIVRALWIGSEITIK